MQIVFMGATLLCLLLNKPYLFSLTQNIFILIQLTKLTYTLRVSICISLIISMTIQKRI